jgi:hypothetical protein
MSFPVTIFYLLVNSNITPSTERQKPVNDTCGKFAVGVNYTGDNLRPTLMTPAANFATSTAGIVDIYRWRKKGTISDC